MKKTHLLLTVLFIAISIQTKGQGSELPGNVTHTNEHTSSGCSGCEVQEVNDWHNSENNHHGAFNIAFETIEITDPATDSCNGRHDRFPRKIIAECFGTVYKDGDDCSIIEDCSAAKCSGSVDFSVKIKDLSANDYDFECLVSSSNLSISYKNWPGGTEKEIKSEEISGLINSPGDAEAEFLLVETPSFELGCGEDTTSITLPVVTIKYKSNTGTKKVIPFTIKPIDITCSSCNEDDTEQKKHKSNQQVLFTTSVYPNPANDQLNFTFTTPTPESLPLHITNVYGQTVYHEVHSLNTGKNTVKVSVSDLVAGTYFYSYITNGTPRLGKVIVQH